MKKYVLSALMVAVVSLACSQQKKGMVVIEGTLHGDLKGTDKIYMYTRTSNDSAIIKDGHYTFSFPFSEVDMKMLYPEYISKMGQAYQPFGILIAEPGTYYITSDITKGMNASELKGPEAMMLYHQFEKEQEEAYGKINTAISGEYGQEWYTIGEKDNRYESLQRSNDSLRNAFLLPILEKMVKGHPDSYASPFALEGAGREIGSIETKEHLLAMLSTRMKASESGKKYADFIKGLKNSAIGKEVVNFSLPDPLGSNIDFKRLKGKYVLIDFWASWCVPCRKSFPHMREVYKKYKGSQFEIYSISIDKDEKAWHKAVKEENNPWLQSLDTKNISQSGFAVTGVPSTFLISPDGKIMAKEVGFDESGNGEIEKKLGEIFGGKVEAKPSNEQNNKHELKLVGKAASTGGN